MSSSLVAGKPGWSLLGLPWIRAETRRRGEGSGRGLKKADAMVKAEATEHSLVGPTESVTAHSEAPFRLHCTGFAWRAGRLFHALQAIGGKQAAAAGSLPLLARSRCWLAPAAENPSTPVGLGPAMRRGGAGRRKGVEKEDDVPCCRPTPPRCCLANGGLRCGLFGVLRAGLQLLNITHLADGCAESHCDICTQ
jgi:hypothetical protein